MCHCFIHETLPNKIIRIKVFFYNNFHPIMCTQTDSQKDTPRNIHSRANYINGTDYLMNFHNLKYVNFILNIFFSLYNCLAIPRNYLTNVGDPLVDNHCIYGLHTTILYHMCLPFFLCFQVWCLCVEQRRRRLFTGSAWAEPSIKFASKTR